jgi:hypothetical protein
MANQIEQRGKQVVDQAQDAAGDVVNTMLSLGRGNVDAYLKASTAFTRTLLTWQRESAAFALDRLDRNIEHVRQIANGGDNEDKVRLQGEFMRETMEEYVHFAQRLSAQGQDVLQQNLQLAHERADAAGEETRQTAGALTRRGKDASRAVEDGAQQAASNS